MHVKGGNTVTTNFSYDGQGVRVKEAVSGGSTTYYIGRHFEVKDGAATKYIFAGNMRIAKVTSSGKWYFHKDHLGSSTAVTDQNGQARTVFRPTEVGLARIAATTSSKRDNLMFRVMLPSLQIDLCPGRISVLGQDDSTLRMERQIGEVRTGHRPVSNLDRRIRLLP